MLINKTIKKEIIKIKFAKTFIKKATGLMFSKEKNFDYCLIFDMGVESKIYSSIHMLFVFYPILLLFLDENKKIVDIRIAKPWGFYSPKNKARYILELPIEYKKMFKENQEISF